MSTDVWLSTPVVNISRPLAGMVEGEGFITVRHEDTAVVRSALDRIISGVRVELVEAD